MRPRLIEHAVHEDARGFFVETYRAEALRELGITDEWVQDNHSRSRHGVLRGLHFQLAPGQAKLVRCVRGEVFDVVVDLRPGSSTYAEWEGFTLTEDGGSLYVPVGFAHGFCVTSEVADVLYKCSTYYAPELERAIAYDDPRIGIEWPELELVVSDRDRQAPRLDAVEPELDFAG